jgi:phosphate transport system substrate-binding protein
LIARKCDLNLTARPPSKEELALANQKGVKIELRPIARDALVFIVNYRNPIKTISREQLVQIYGAKLKSWSELGGATTNIVAFWRERQSGSRELFDTLVTPSKPFPEPERMPELFANSMGGPFCQVGMNPYGIGYSVYYYEHFLALSPYTRIVAIDGVEPTPETIASGKYPYAAKVYAAYRADESEENPGMKLLNWILSPEGQAVVRESAYVPFVSETL